MTDDLASQLQNLQNVRELLGEETYQQNLDKLRQRYGAEEVDTLLQQPSPPPPSQTIHNDAPNQGVQGIVHGNVYLDGQRTKSNEELLAAYLQRQVQRCDSLSLQGVYQQKSSEDVLTISLGQVYTQLATTDITEREVYEGEALQSLDAEAYLKEHTGSHLLPLQQRSRVRPEGIPARQEGMRELWPDLDTLSAQALATYAEEAERLTFLGPQLVSEAIASCQHLVLLGEPGSGKSTALRHLALTLAQAGLDKSVTLAAHLEGWGSLGEQGRLLPLFLPLLSFAKKVVTPADHPCCADDLWDFFAAELESNGRYPGLAAAVHEELEQGRGLLLLDGLDEVVGSESRGQVVRAVQAFAAHYPACRIVVTCRVRAYEGEHNRAWQLPGWHTATLADWTVGQMQHFVQAWYVAAAAASKMNQEKRDERIGKLKGAIELRGDLKRLGVRPLLLTIMALVHFNDGELPEERVGLYSRCVDLLLGQWELAKEDSDYRKLTDYIGLPDTNVNTLRPLLQQAAFAAHEASTLNASGSLGRDTLRLMVMEALAQKSHPNPFQGAEWFLEYTDVRSGLLQASDAGDAYVFPHLTFQEYLAGLELVSKVKSVNRILEKRNDDRWRVPILLGVGHLVSEGALAMAYQLLSELVYLDGRSDEQQQRDLLFASELAEDVGWMRLESGGTMFKNLRRDLAAALVPVVEGTTLPAKERVRAGFLLGDLGDPRPSVNDLPPAMVEIAGGEFVIGSTEKEAEEAGKASEQFYLERGDKENAKRSRTWTEGEINNQSMITATFGLARYPITNAQYKLFIDDGGYKIDAPWWNDAAQEWLRRDDEATKGLGRWQKRQYKHQPEFWNDNRYGIARPNHPVVGISWYEAVAFCRWLTKHVQDGYAYRLPTEAEWEYAVRRATRRVYPWGNEEPDGERANFNRIYEGTTAVGCFSQGATTDGLHDLAGNVWEWTGSVYKPYPYDPQDGREDTSNPANKRFVARGGGWLNFSPILRAPLRYVRPPDDQYQNLGLRPARHLPAARDE